MDTPQIPNTTSNPPAPASPPSGPTFSLPPTPSPATPSPLAAAGISSAVKTAGFFSTKVIGAIIGIAVIGGGIAVGYFFFPEPFYNAVGKYIGLPAPEVVETRATAEEPAEEIPEIPVAEVGTSSEIVPEKPIDEESPADLPLLNEPEPPVEKIEEVPLEELKKEDIPSAPIDKEAVFGGKVRRKKD